MLLNIHAIRLGSKWRKHTFSSPKASLPADRVIEDILG